MDISTETSKLQKWAIENEPDEKWLWKGAWWEHIIFFRDVIIPLLYKKDYEVEDRDKAEKQVSSKYDIIGSHYSKSTKLPVYKFNLLRAEIIVRYNFYDYEIVVNSPIELKIPPELYTSDPSMSFEGIPSCYKEHKAYPECKAKFCMQVWSKYVFYTAMFIIKHQLIEAANTADKK